MSNKEMKTLAESELLQLGVTAAGSGTSLKCGAGPAKGFQMVLSKGKKKKKERSSLKMSIK